MVIQKSHTHQRGSGLLYSSRSPSQAWPVVSASPGFLRLLSESSSRPHATMLASVMPAIHRFQKLLVKSLMGLLLPCIVVQDGSRRLFEALLVRRMKGEAQ